MENDAIITSGTRVTVLKDWGGNAGNYFRRMSQDTAGTVIGNGRIGGNLIVKTDDDSRQWEIPKRGIIAL